MEVEGAHPQEEDHQAVVSAGVKAQVAALRRLHDLQSLKRIIIITTDLGIKAEQ